MREFGRQLKEVRETLGLSQGEAAKTLEVSRQTVNNWERNRHNPTVEHALRVQEMLRISKEVKNSEEN